MYIPNHFKVAFVLTILACIVLTIVCITDTQAFLKNDVDKHLEFLSTYHLDQLEKDMDISEVFELVKIEKRNHENHFDGEARVVEVFHSNGMRTVLRFVNGGLATANTRVCANEWVNLLLLN